MLTRIEIDGFKTFSDFALDLGPFQVIAGANGAGKSNLFDALALLSELVGDNDVRTAFRAVRGEADGLFTFLPNGGSTSVMTLAAEMLVDTKVEDGWGVTAQIKYTRLRYEIIIEHRIDQHGIQRLYVTHESLNLIQRGTDSWIHDYKFKGNAAKRLPPIESGRKPFISTEGNTFSLHQDGRSGRQNKIAGPIERTILSSVSNTEFPHAYAARQEMRTWRFIQLNPEVLRNPCSVLSPPFLDIDGANLPAVLARLKANDPFILTDISRDLANLVPGVLDIDVEHDKTRDQYVVWAN
ncbi:MAG: AAA family ATPase, partial [Chloroflexota bacterium]